MGCIRVEKITEYLCEPLSRCLRDEDPYVRKTAAICVAKLYDISPELVEDRGFLEVLHDLISDANPTVVANAVAALSEIAESSGKNVMNVTSGILQKLLAALNECTEWGQVFILDSLSSYTPLDSREAEGIIERVSPRLQHANSAVVMSAVKIILKYMDEIESQEIIRSYSKKLTPPLVTLLNSEPEIQYVALRNINLIVQKRAKILEHEIKVFFCKYNDPIYVKMEKLEIIIRLVSINNVDQVLLEFKEYATEVDVDFVRKAVRAIGRCAIKLDRAAERCINVLLDLLQNKVNYVVQEAIVVIKDIFRKYPNRYESIIATLCENLEDLDEPEAKASMIWIIGEYAERIDNADELLDSFLESFSEETATVQLQLLTATVKLFLKSPDTSQEMVQKVLNLATEESDNPDLRDRGYIYWRLLSSDPEAARAVVLSEKPEIGDDTSQLEPSLLEDLMNQIATLASIYHKPAEAFVVKSVALSGPVDEEDEIEEEALGEEDGHPAAGQGYGSYGGSTGGGGDLLDLMDDMGGAPTASSSSTVKKNPMVTSEQGKGVFISGAMVKVNGQPTLMMDIGNATNTPVQALAVQLNKSAFGLVPVNPQITLTQAVANGTVCATTFALSVNPAMINPQDASPGVQAAIKNMSTGDVFYFAIPVALEALLVAHQAMDVNALATAWKGIDESQEVSAIVNDMPTADPTAVQAKLAAIDVSFVTQRNVPGADGVQQAAVYFTCTTDRQRYLLVEIKFKAGFNLCKVTVRSQNKAMSELCKVAISKLLVM